MYNTCVKLIISNTCIYYRHYIEFSKAVRDVVSSLPMANDIIPHDGLVFDYFLDQKSQQFLPWSERKRDSGTSKPNTPIDTYVPIPEVCVLIVE